MKNILLLLLVFPLLIIQIHYSRAQKITYVLSHTQPIDSNRYSDIKGDPYLFRDFVKARITDNQMEVFDSVYINFNGYTQEFEVEQEGWFTELDRKWYRQIEVLSDNPENYFREDVELPILFRRGVHEKFGNRFVELCYMGKSVMLIKDFSVSLATKEVQDVGKTVVFKRFHPKSLYYVLANGKLNLLVPKKKSILKVLGAEEELVKFIKTEKINLSDDRDLIKLIAYYEKVTY